MTDEIIENEITAETEKDSAAIEAASTENSAQSDVEKSVNVAVDGQEKLSAEVVDPEAIDGDFVIAKPEIVYHLSDFDGPIPMLYQLIKDAKIRIEDIFISEVTSQYVEIIKNTPKEELDFDYAGEFI